MHGEGSSIAQQGSGYTNLREENGAGKHLLVCEVISSK